MFQQPAGNTRNSDRRSGRRASVETRSGRRVTTFATKNRPPPGQTRTTRFPHLHDICARHTRAERLRLSWRAHGLVASKVIAKSAVGSNQHRCFDVGPAHAQIGQAAVSFGEGMRHESDRKIDLDSFSPAVLHESMVPRRARLPYKKINATSTRYFLQLSMISPTAIGKSTDEFYCVADRRLGQGRKAPRLPVRYVNLVPARALQRITDRRIARADTRASAGDAGRRQ